VVYIEKVEGTLKQGVYAKLGPKTVIYGPNGAGKSSVIQAMELATCGHVSDVEGREQVKQANAIGRLFPADEDLFVEAQLSDGTKFRWSMERNKEDGYKRPEHDAPRQIAWPVQDLKAMLTGDAASVQTWLEAQVVGPVTEEDVLRSVSPAVHDIVKTIIRKLRKHDMLAIAKEAKSKARTMRMDATKAETTVEQLMQGLTAPLMQADRDALEAQLAHMQGAIGEGRVTAAQKAALDAEVVRLQQAIAQLVAARAALVLPPPTTLQAATTVNTALDLVRSHATALGLDVCWTCGNTEPDFKAHVEKLTALEASLKDAVSSVKQQYSYDAQIEATNQVLSRAEAQAAAAVVAPDTTTERDAIVRRIAADDNARRAWANAASQRQQIDVQRIQADQLTLASKALEKAGKDMVESRKAVFEAHVTKFLPPGDVFGVDLDSARVGLVRDGQIHSALSGAEWTRVLLALAASRSGGSTPSVLAPEDRAWDRDTLHVVMEALRDSEVQIVLMATVKPEPVDGWTLIDLTEGT
jgi:hypothetical protein